MREFVIEEFERFLEIADTINSPFKFYEISESDAGENYRLLEAKVWLRTAYVSWEADLKGDEINEYVATLKRHGFTKTEIRETAYPIK